MSGLFVLILIIVLTPQIGLIPAILIIFGMSIAINYYRDNS